MSYNFEIVETIFNKLLTEFNQKVIDENLNYNFETYYILINNNNFSIHSDPYKYSQLGIESNKFENYLKELFEKYLYTNFNFVCKEYLYKNNSLIELTLTYEDFYNIYDYDEEISENDNFEMNSNLLNS